MEFLIGISIVCLLLLSMLGWACGSTNQRTHGRRGQGPKRDRTQEREEKGRKQFDDGWED